MSDETRFEFASNTESWREAMNNADFESDMGCDNQDRLFGGTRAYAVALAKEFDAVILFWNKEEGLSFRVGPDGAVRTL